MSKDTDPHQILEFKAASFTLPVLRLFSSHLGSITAKLQKKMSEAPDFFNHAPVVIELNDLAVGERVDLPLLVSFLRRSGLVPVGIRGGTAAYQEVAVALDLAVMAERSDRRRPSREEEPVPVAVATPPPPPPCRPGQVVAQTVHAGQRIYATGRDLVLLSNVNPGAEVMADGHIHIHGALRGRALAGVQGNTECRIFCRELRAELISVAGHYRVSENLPGEFRGKPVQVGMEGQTMTFLPML
ncbi:MAG: septum site-determining protein MinC [Pseudomonadota bacterium]